MNFARPGATSLVRVEPDGTGVVEGEDLWFPNGMAIDGDELIVAETFAGRADARSRSPPTARSTTAASGARSRRAADPAPAAEMIPRLGFAPDGIALDAEGHAWVADGLGGPTVRVAPGGEIVDEIRLPEGLQAFACALGGEDGRELLLCSAPDFIEANRKDVREAFLFTTTVDVPDRGLP